MGKLADEVLAEREMRDAAKASLEERIAKIKSDLEERGIAGRIADEVSQSAQETLDEAMHIASESKGIITGTLAVLALWLLRNPILSWLENALNKSSDSKNSGKS